MSAFRPTLYSAKELKALTPKKRAALKKEIAKHVKTHPEVRKILRRKTRPMYDKLKAQG
jgi:hypothetical protein